MTIKTFDSKSAFGYTQITTFYSDFSIADNFGINEVKDTYKRAFESWKSNYKYLTELYGNSFNVNNFKYNNKLWINYTEARVVYDD